MKPLTPRQVEARLRANGFVRSHGVGSHRCWFNPVTNRYTVVSHHGNAPLPHLERDQKKRGQAVFIPMEDVQTERRKTERRKTQVRAAKDLSQKMLGPGSKGRSASGESREVSGGQCW